MKTYDIKIQNSGINVNYLYIKKHEQIGKIFFALK